MAEPPVDAGAGGHGPRLLLGTRAGMSLQEVLAAVPGTAVYAPPAGRTEGHAVLAGHEDVEVAGVSGRARFGFVDGRLASVAFELDQRGGDEELVFAVRQLVVLTSEVLGPPSRLVEAPPPSPGVGPRGEAGRRSFRATWSSERVSVELDVIVEAGAATGSVMASVTGRGG